MKATRGYFAKIAGYVPRSDVIEHSKVDLDQYKIEECLGLDPPDFECAYKWYSDGGNSLEKHSTRTIQKFSTEAELKLDRQPWYGIYKAYWGDPTYGDTWIQKVKDGVGEFNGVKDVVRVESFQKATNYQIVWMHIIHELEAAKKECVAGNLCNNDAWDRAWAFYAGSLEGADGSGDGHLMLNVAEKRCRDFNTCTADDDGDDASGMAQVNSDNLALWEKGSRHLLAGECTEASMVKNKIVHKMTVPLVQGTLRYFYAADPTTEVYEGDKGRAALWAYAASVLPRIAYCNVTAAANIRANADIAKAPMTDGWVAMKQEMESVYSCLGITCAEVGGLLDEAGTGEYYVGFEPCDDGSTPGGRSSGGGEDKIALPPYSISGLLTVFCFATAIMLVTAAFWRRKLAEYSSNTNYTAIATRSSRRA